ncbi:MAG: hypothetical protein WCG97_03930 [bacterium]
MNLSDSQLVYGGAFLFLIVWFTLQFIFSYDLRGKKMRNLALKFKLSYDPGDKSRLTLLSIPKYKKHIITGILNNHRIEIYDLIEKGPARGVRGYYNTTFRIDDGYADGSGLALLMPVNKIEDELVKLVS